MERWYPSMRVGIRRVFCVIILCFSIFLPFHAYAQLENVPVENPVYEFLKRMQVKGLIQGYNSAVLPVSRREVAQYLEKAIQQKDKMTQAENGMLDDFLIEFEFDMKHQTQESDVILSGSELSKIADIFTDKEKYLCAWHDSSNSLFMDFLFSTEQRGIRGGTRGNSGVTLFNWGGRVRGVLGGTLGYYLEATNGQLVGDKDFALSDISLKEIYKINEPGSMNFDVTEGYLKWDAKFLDIQLGRERILWGVGYGDRLIVSKNPPPMDFVRVEATLGVFRYSFVHCSLLGRKNLRVRDSLAGPEPIINAKYMAAHRLDIGIGSDLDIGITEMVVYSKRFPDLAYLNPLVFYKSVEHSLQDRDNAFIVIDAQSRFIPKVELSASLFIDDIDFSRLGTNWYGNELAYQAGFSYVEPIGVQDLDLRFDYTRINPYVYSHHLVDNDYSTNGFVIGHHLGPNSDDTMLRIAYRYSSRLSGSLTYEYERHGSNIRGLDGSLIRNVGGDYLQGHRTVDSEEVTFLDGMLMKISHLRFNVLYEPFNEFLIEAEYEMRRTSDGTLERIDVDNLLFIRLKIDI
jgi:hypothetical protein